MAPQRAEGRHEPTSFMKPAPHPNDDEFGTPNDDLVADPLADSTWALWNDTARRNREIFTEIFRPVPTNLVRDWKAYDVRPPTSRACTPYSPVTYRAIC